MIINNLRHRIKRKTLGWVSFLAVVDIFTFLHGNSNRRMGVGVGGGRGNSSFRLSLSSSGNPRSLIR